MNRRNQGGWTAVEVLFATVAMVAIAAVGAYAFSGATERSQSRVKAAWAAQEIANFLNRVSSASAVVDWTFADGRRLLKACGVDAGDTTIPGAGVTVHCVDPVLDATATIEPPLPPLPERCSGTLANRLNALSANYAPGMGRPTATELRQGIWVPADNDADARAIAHLVQSGLDGLDKASWPRQPLGLTVRAAGVLICL